MKRQKLRKILLLLSLIFFPITLNYFSPYLIVDGAFKGIVSGSGVTFTVLFLSSFFFGRFFCGWICPAGGLQEASLMAEGRRFTNAKAKWLKYMIWLIWIGAIVGGFVVAGGIIEINPIYNTDYGISVNSVFSYIIYLPVVLLIFVIPLFSGRRGMCHSICWMAPFMVLGQKLSQGLRSPYLHLKADKDKCIECKMCSKACPMSIDVMANVKQGNMKDMDCILCGECIDTCPKKVIRFGFKH